MRVRHLRLGQQRAGRLYAASAPWPPLPQAAGLRSACGSARGLGAELPPWKPRAPRTARRPFLPQAVYTGDRQNLRVEGGRLVITARREAGGDRGQRITSARIRSYGKFSVAPSAAAPAVRIEARISVPSGEPISCSERPGRPRARPLRA